MQSDISLFLKPTSASIQQGVEPPLLTDIAKGSAKGSARHIETHSARKAELEMLPLKFARSSIPRTKSTDALTRAKSTITVSFSGFVDLSL